MPVKKDLRPVILAVKDAKVLSFSFLMVLGVVKSRYREGKCLRRSATSMIFNFSSLIEVASPTPETSVIGSEKRILEGINKH